MNSIKIKNIARFLMAAGGLLLFYQSTDPAPTDILWFGGIIAICFIKFSLSRVAKIYIAFLIVYIFSSALSMFSWRSPAYGALYFIIDIYLMFVPFALIIILNNYDKLRDVSMYFLIGCLVSGALGVIGYIGIAPGPKEWYFASSLGLRLSPLFKDPNVYAPYLMFGIFYGVGLLLMGRFKSRFLIVLLAICSIAMLLAFSRATWLGAAVSTAVLIFIIAVKERRVLVLQRQFLSLLAVVLVGGGVGIYFNAPAETFAFFENRLQLQYYDVNRFSAQREAIEVIRDNPFGIGPGHYVNRNIFEESIFMLEPHNIYLRIAAERGIIAFLSFVGLITYILFSLSKIALSDHARSWVAVGLLALLVGLMANLFFIDGIRWRHLYFMLGLALCEIALFKNSQMRISKQSKRGIR